MLLQLLLLLMMLTMCALFFYFRFVLSFKSGFHQKQGRRREIRRTVISMREIHLGWLRLGFPKLKMYPFSHNHGSIGSVEDIPPYETKVNKVILDGIAFSTDYGRKGNDLVVDC